MAAVLVGVAAVEVDLAAVAAALAAAADRGGGSGLRAHTAALLYR